MDTDEMEALRFPVGRFAPPARTPTDDDVAAWIAEIEDAPRRLREAVEGLSDAQLDTRYRPEGWTVRQVAHHVADSHANSFVRFKWALTEDEPTIKAYFEARWAELADYALPLAPSLDYLDALHARWTPLLRSLGPDERARGFIHPETGDRVRLDVNMAIYAWHSRHHIAHITALARRAGW
ncbi:MAG: YfiT family bacillithiol transferase [Planctomycetota bacterium]